MVVYHVCVDECDVFAAAFFQRLAERVLAGEKQVRHVLINVVRDIL